MSKITEETGTAPATGLKPKPSKKARVAPRRAPVAPAKAKSPKKDHPQEESAQGPHEDRGGQTRGRPRRQQDWQDPRPAETA